MAYIIEESVAGGSRESESTAKIIGQLTDESLEKQVTSGGRSHGFLAWHVIHPIGENVRTLFPQTTL